MSKFDLGHLARCVLRVEAIPYGVFTAIGVAVLVVVGGIASRAWQHGGLLPPPTQSERYACSAPTGPFSLVYQRGTDRVQIKSALGLLDGTVRNQRFDWQGFASDRSLLGFAPPAQIVADDGTTLRVAGPDFQDVRCTRAADPAQPRAATAP